MKRAWVRLSNEQWAVVGVALSLAALYLFLRLPQIAIGLPYIDYWDEAQVAWSGVQIALGQDWTVRFFNYGNLPIYLVALSVGPVYLWYWLNGERLLLENALPFDGYPWLVDYGEIMAVARSLWLIAGLLAVIGILILLNRFFGLVAATAGAVLLAINPMHVQFSTRIAPDGLASALALASLGLATAYLTEKRPSLLYFSAGFAALAAATKYNYGSVLFAAVVAYLIQSLGERARLRIRRVVFLLGTAALTFLLAMPSVFVKPLEFIDGVVSEIAHYQNGHDGHESEPWLGQLLFQAGQFNSTWGMWALILAGVGFIGLVGSKGLARKVALVWTLPFIPFLLVMLSGTVNFHRNYLLLYPVVALLAGAGVHYITFTDLRVLNWAVPRALQVVCGATLVAMSLVPNVPNGVRGSLEAVTFHDSRQQLVEEIGFRRLCQEVDQALVDDRIFLSPRQWLRYCPEIPFRRLEIDKAVQESAKAVSLLISLPGDHGLENPLQTFNEGGSFAGFGPDFNPPLELYLVGQG